MNTPTADHPPSGLPPATEAMPLLVAAVIVHDRTTDQVVLIQRGPNSKFAPGRWDLPVGKSEAGEPITTTAVRELQEETGLTVDQGDLEVAHIIHSPYGVEAPNGFLTIVFAAHRWTGQLANMEPDRHAQVAWTSTDAIPADFVSTTATALSGYLNHRIGISTDGW